MTKMALYKSLILLMYMTLNKNITKPQDKKKILYGPRANLKMSKNFWAVTWNFFRLWLRVRNAQVSCKLPYKTGSSSQTCSISAIFKVWNNCWFFFYNFLELCFFYIYYYYKYIQFNLNSMVSLYKWQILYVSKNTAYYIKPSIKHIHVLKIHKEIYFCILISRFS